MKLCQLGVGVMEDEQTGENVLVLTVFTEGSQHEFAVADWPTRLQFRDKMTESIKLAVADMKPPKPALITAQGALPNGFRRPKS